MSIGIAFEKGLTPLPGERLRVLTTDRDWSDRDAEVVAAGDGFLDIRFTSDGASARLVVGEDAWRWAETHKQRKARRV